MKAPQNIRKHPNSYVTILVSLVANAYFLWSGGIPLVFRASLIAVLLASIVSLLMTESGADLLERSIRTALTFCLLTTLFALGLAKEGWIVHITMVGLAGTVMMGALTLGKDMLDDWLEVVSAIGLAFLVPAAVAGLIYLIVYLA